MSLEIRHLELLVMVEAEGTLTGAASRLHLTQSALSHQLRELERELETSLFYRAGKKMILTQAGERLTASAHSVIEELARAKVDIHRIATGQTGLIRLSTACYTCYHWLPQLIHQFREAYPTVNFEIVAEATRQPLPALLSGKLDLAIVNASVDDSRLKAQRLFQDELVVLMPPNHPLANHAFINAEHLVNEHLILYANYESALFTEVLQPAGVRLGQVTWIQLTEAILELVKAGLGISVMARWAAAPQLQAGELRALPLLSAGLHRQWYAVSIDDATPQYLQAFVDLMASNPFHLNRGFGTTGRSLDAQ